MVASLHFATGAASALLVQNCLSAKYDWNYDVGQRYFWGFVAGLFSHVLFDAIPHAEYSMEGEALLTLLCLEAAFMMWLLLPNKDPVMSQLLAWGLVGAALPDVLGMAGRHLGLEILTWPYKFLHLPHGIAKPLFAGFGTQIGIVIVCVLYVRIRSAFK